MSFIVWLNSIRIRIVVGQMLSRSEWFVDLPFRQYTRVHDPTSDCQAHCFRAVRGAGMSGCCADIGSNAWWVYYAHGD